MSRLITTITLILLAIERIDSHRIPSNRPPRLIVFSFDAFRLDYLHPQLTPTLYRLSLLGVSASRMRSVYVTKTFPNHQSISTGMYQETHGIVSNFMFDPVTNDTFKHSTTDSRWWDNGIVKPIWASIQLYSMCISLFV
jgi:predicted AlkP superfamily pyrophosphatase or phosphodiesterase